MGPLVMTAELQSQGARAPDIDHLAWVGRYAFGASRQTAELWRGRSLLDLGCGSGFLCAEARRQGATHVVGIDLCPPDAATLGWQFLKVNLDSATWATEVPREPAAPGAGAAGAAASGFDLVCAFDILEHLASPVHFLSGCRALLKTGGKLVLTTPNTASWERVLRGERWSGATDPQHRILFTRYSLDFLLRRVGLQASVLRAPVRSLERLGLPFPQIGAQILCVATVV